MYEEEEYEPTKTDVALYMAGAAVGQFLKIAANVAITSMGVASGIMLAARWLGVRG